MHLTLGSGQSQWFVLNRHVPFSVESMPASRCLGHRKYGCWETSLEHHAGLADENVLRDQREEIVLHMCGGTGLV